MPDPRGHKTLGLRGLLFKQDNGDKLNRVVKNFFPLGHRLVEWHAYGEGLNTCTLAVKYGSRTIADLAAPAGLGFKRDTNQPSIAGIPMILEVTDQNDGSITAENLTLDVVFGQAGTVANAMFLFSDD